MVLSLVVCWWSWWWWFCCQLLEFQPVSSIISISSNWLPLVLSVAVVVLLVLSVAVVLLLMTFIMGFMLRLLKTSKLVKMIPFNIYQAVYVCQLFKWINLFESTINYLIGYAAKYH